MRRSRAAVVGNASLLSDLGRGSAKGNLVASRHRYVQEEHGPEVVEKVAARLEGQARPHFVKPPLPFLWVPLPTLVEIDEAIVEVAMDGDASRMLPFGQRIARYDLSVLYRVLFRVGTPPFVLGRLPMAYGQYFRDAGRIGSRTSAKSARVELEGFVLPRYLCEHGISGWLHAAVEVSGGDAIEVRHAGCVHTDGDACAWEVGWS